MASIRSAIGKSLDCRSQQLQSAPPHTAPSPRPTLPRPHTPPPNRTTYTHRSARVDALCCTITLVQTGWAAPGQRVLLS